MPPSFGSEPARSARASTSATEGSTYTSSPKKGRPARAGRPIAPRGAAYLVAAAAEKAEQGKHEHDDQDDPEQAHSVLLSVTLSVRHTLASSSSPVCEILTPRK